MHSRSFYFSGNFKHHASTANRAWAGADGPRIRQDRDVESDPLKPVDFGSAVFRRPPTSWQTPLEDDGVRRYFKDKSMEADYKWLEGKLPGREISVPSRTRDVQLWLVTAGGDTEPGETGRSEAHT